jgi:hypothetical protein
VRADSFPASSGDRTDSGPDPVSTAAIVAAVRAHVPPLEPSADPGPVSPATLEEYTAELVQIVDKRARRLAHALRTAHHMLRSRARTEKRRQRQRLRLRNRERAEERRLLRKRDKDEKQLIKRHREHRQRR